MDFDRICELLPQKPPFVMVDRVLELEPGRRIVCTRNITGNEGFFQGHFPGFAVMPGSLILEGLAQASILLFRADAPGPADPGVVYLFGSVRAKMKNIVRPGDVLRYEVTPLKALDDGGAVEGTASVDGTPCVEAELYFTRVKADSLRSPTA